MGPRAAGPAPGGPCLVNPHSLHGGSARGHPSGRSAQAMLPGHHSDTPARGWKSQSLCPTPVYVQEARTSFR